jgi:ubiquitin C-terminal hydrolase
MNIAREILEKHLNKDLDIKTYLKGSALTYEVVLDALDEAINYTRCSTQLLCVNSNVDGLTAGKYYKKLYQDRTHTKVLDDYGIETMYFSDRFIKPPSKQ